MYLDLVWVGIIATSSLYIHRFILLALLHILLIQFIVFERFWYNLNIEWISLKFFFFSFTSLRWSYLLLVGINHLMKDCMNVRWVLKIWAIFLLFPAVLKRTHSHSIQQSYENKFFKHLWMQQLKGKFQRGIEDIFEWAWTPITAMSFKFTNQCIKEKLQLIAKFTPNNVYLTDLWWSLTHTSHYLPR